MNAPGSQPSDAPAVGDAAGLAADLAARGVACDVEAHARLALLVPRAALPELAEPARRRELQALATARGFTHVALELDPAGRLA